MRFRLSRAGPVLVILLVANGLPRAHAQQTDITLRAGLLLDGKGGERTLADVVIRDGRIAIVRTATDDPTYDLSHLTVMPGGIDTHVHLNWHFDPDGKTHHLSPDEETRSQAALYAVENGYVTLMGGITTVQSLGSPIDKDVRDFIERGIVPGPRVVTSLRAITGRSGTPAEIRATVLRLADDGADVIKIFASASIRVGGTPTLSQEQLDAACGQARARGLRTAVHAHGAESAQRAVRAGCTVIEHGAFLDEATLDMMAENGTYYDPHIGLIFQNYFQNRDRYIGIGGYTEEGFVQMENAVPRALDVFRAALTRPDLRIVFGTDAVAGAHGRNFEELIYRVTEGGQAPMDAIVSATSRAAESLRLGDRIGSIEPGFDADLIAIEGNPLDDITALRKVRFVMRRGVVYKNEHR